MTNAARKYRIRIVHDSSPQNPFEDWDCEYSIVTDYNGLKDYSDGQIYRYLSNYLSDGQIIYHQQKLLAMMGDYTRKNIQDAEDKEEKINILQEAIDEYLNDGIDNMICFCEKFKVKHYSGISRGYSQGDASTVLVVPTPEDAKRLGFKIEEVREEAMKATFTLYGNWAWGDTYGFIIEELRMFKKTYTDREPEETEEDSEWQEIDSCYGFYGREAEENGMIDNIDFKDYGWTREQAIELINDAEIEYSKY